MAGSRKKPKQAGSQKKPKKANPRKSPEKVNIAPKYASLPGLPKELFNQIVADLPNSDLLRLAEACPRLQPPLRHFIFESVVIRSYDRVHKLARVLTENGALGYFVGRYAVEIEGDEQLQWHQNHMLANHWDPIPFTHAIYGYLDVRILALLPNLEHLRIITPRSSRWALLRHFSFQFEHMDRIPQPQPLWISTTLKTRM